MAISFGEDEGDHSAEADPPAPQGGGQGDIADRAHAAQDGDDGADQGVLERGPEPVPLEEKSAPEVGRDENGQ
jgi:hypothetical protein